MFGRSWCLDSWVPADRILGVELYADRFHAPPLYQHPGMGYGAIVLIWTDYGFGYTVSG